MKIIDLSWPLRTTMTGYKNKKSFESTFIKNFPHDAARESTITLNTHAGTHVDAPSHFIEHGAPVESIHLEQLIGRAQVVDCTTIVDAITIRHLESFAFEQDTIILFKTKNSFLDHDEPFDPSFVYLDESAAHFLVSKKVKAVGIDYLGIERNQPDHATHLVLLENNIAIIEGLRLKSVEQKEYFFVCLPLALELNEAAPARAVVFEKIIS